MLLAPPRKKPKNKSNKGKGPRLKVQDENVKLLAMPLDIMAEIASLLQPVDLLQLGRSCKDLHSKLKSEAYTTCWIRAEGGLPGFPGNPVPPGPPDLLRPEYAALIFNKTCMKCHGPKPTNYDFRAKQRVCNKCYSLPKYDDIGSSGLTGFERVWDGITGPESNIALIYKAIPKTPNKARFCPAYAKRVLKLCMAKQEKLSKEDYATFMEHRENMMDEITQHGLKLQVWHLVDREDKNGTWKTRVRERKERVQGRCVEITSRLATVGISREDFPIPTSPHYSDWESAMCWQADMTDKVWSRVKYILFRLLVKEQAWRLGEVGLPAETP